MPIISGILRDGAGVPLTGCTIKLKSVSTSRDVLATTVACISTNTGQYHIDVLPGQYEVSLRYEGAITESRVGIIHVHDDSPDGTLNSFLNAKNSDTRPEALRQFDALVQRAETAADTSGSGADSAAASAAVAGQYAEAAKTHAKQAAASEEAAGGYAQAAAGSASAAGSSAAQAAESHTGAQQVLEEARQIAKDMVKPPPVFYRPAEERGIWQRSYDGTERTSKWTFSGNLTRSSYDVFFYGPDAWEVRYPLSEAANPLRYGFSTRFSVLLKDGSDTALEGKDLAEVRLVISDDMVSPGYQVPPATPDKPHLVLGWVARYQNNKLLILPLDSAETPSGQFAALSGFSRNTWINLGLSLSPGSPWQYFLYESNHNGSPLWLTRTGVSTPVNTLCIRSMTPAKETHFRYLEVVVQHEVFSHRLTPEDDGATFYFPWGYDSNSGLILPDTELPPGFSVTSLAEPFVYPSILLENNNITFITISGESISGSKTVSGKQWITHVGNKIWNIR